MRISRPHMFMQMAEVAAMRSTCERGNVGAILTRNNDIVCMGYNGPPSGEVHCQGNDCQLRSDGGCSRSRHAERNAIERGMAKVDLWECHLYCTYSPCLECAKLIVRFDIHYFYYRYSYRDPAGLDYLKNHNCYIYRITPAGYVIDEDGRIVNVG
jgi:dCMP deaminase